MLPAYMDPLSSRWNSLSVCLGPPDREGSGGPRPLRSFFFQKGDYAKTKLLREKREEGEKLKLWCHYEATGCPFPGAPQKRERAAPDLLPEEMNNEDRGEVRVEGLLKGGRGLEEELDPP